METHFRGRLCGAFEGVDANPVDVHELLIAFGQLLGIDMSRPCFGAVAQSATDEHEESGRIAPRPVGVAIVATVVNEIGLSVHAAHNHVGLPFNPEDIPALHVR